MILSVNPEYDKLVSKLPSEQYNSLKESIKQNGLWMPIVVNPQGEILDGHHRFRACIELKLQTKFAVREFDNKLLEKKFVVECNLQRRQLNDFQKAELGMALLKINEELAAKRQQEGLPTIEGGTAVQHTADTIGMSRGTFERAKKVIQEAPEQTKEKLREGKKDTSINKEYKSLLKDQKKEKRQTEISNLQVNLPERVTLHNSEFQKIFVEGNSVSLIITDPPYHEKDLHLYDDLAVHANRVLREGGSLLCYAGHYAIGEIISKVESHGLKFQWPMAILHGGPTAAIFGRKVLVGYMPMLWFVKGKYDGEFIKDVIQSEFQGKELHDWAKSTVEADYFIQYMTIENEIVYDPFLGQGTFGVSAVKNNRQFIGCEVNPEHFENARRLISNAK